MDESVTKNFGNLAVASPDTVQVQEPGKALRLSEAIRIGAKLRPQCIGAMFSDGKSCALGAAYEAVFGHPRGDDDELHMAQTEQLRQLQRVVRLPHNPIDEIGRYKNDRGWTREQIADWLESQGY